ncbi:MAG TPA: adenosylcobinamide-phosphate synthase CbiB [Stellaceae bacterium]|nr:adenosylcobinamide-phosphate synthase CbiB [Stellaceae bacterium]
MLAQHFHLLFLPQLASTRVAILVLALLLDACVGDPPWLFRWLPHPVAVIGRAVRSFDRRLNVSQRSFAVRRVRGILVTIFLGMTALALGIAISAGLGYIRHGWLVEMLLVTVLVAQRDLYDHVVRVMRALDRDSLEEGRAAVSRIVGRDPETLDEYGVARAGIESLAENFSDGVVGPVLAYVLAGLPGLLFYKTISTLDSMIGHRDARYQAFGWASARLDDLLNLLPARLSALMLTIASAFVPKTRPFQALITMWQDARKHRSPNAGWPESAMAGALGVSLGGPRRYGGVVIADPWLGTGRARATPHDMRRALMVFVVACILQLGLLSGLALLLTA